METAKPSTQHSWDTSDLNFPILADSGIHKDDDGYARTVLLTGWSKKGSRLMKADIRVDRSPEGSYADAHIWTEAGWVRVTSINPNIWWSTVPGFQRAGNQASLDKTMRLSADLAVELRKIERYADL